MNNGLTWDRSDVITILEKVLPMTVHLIVIICYNNRLTYQVGAVIFVSWNHAFHAHNQDCKKLHTVKSLRLGQQPPSTSSEVAPQVNGLVLFYHRVIYKSTSMLKEVIQHMRKER